jgi:predicted DNA-binding transcriptional regulator AlpA
MYRNGMQRSDHDLPTLSPALDDLTTRFWALPYADQLEFVGRLEEALPIERSLMTDELVQQRETLTCLRAAMRHLGLERPLTVKEYQVAQGELGLAWSSQRILRLWRSFEHAARAAAGGRLPRTWQYRDFLRQHLRGKPARTREEYLWALRTWLATSPPTETAAGYNAFAREHNLTLGKGELPLPFGGTMVNVLALPFSELVAIARGDKEYPAAARARRDDADWSRGPDDLISIRTIALMSGRSKAAAVPFVLGSDFPPPVIDLPAGRVWLRDEVHAYLAGEWQEPQPPNRLRHSYMTAGEVAERLGFSRNSVAKTPRFPRAVARVGRCKLWLRSEVEEYAATNALEIKRRRERRTPKGRRSAFVTRAALKRELEMTGGQIDSLLAEPSFPNPLRRFGDGAIWARVDVEAYLDGRPLEDNSPLAAMLMSSKEVEEAMALIPGRDRHKRHYPDLPEPVARTRGGYVYLRPEVEAMLEQPGAKERLERRRARRSRGASSSVDR